MHTYKYSTLNILEVNLDILWKNIYMYLLLEMEMVAHSSILTIKEGDWWVRVHGVTKSWTR